VRQILGLIFNLTHDNTARTLEPPAAAIKMSCSPTGSTRGDDNLLPLNLSVVTKFREYPRTAPDNALQPLCCLINRLHVEMATSGME
jgi:hypothetical protein